MIWLVLIAMGLTTYALRVSLIGVLHRLALPPLVTRALRFVPPAVLSAIILPNVLAPADHLDLTLRNPRLLAGLLAALVAWRTRSVILTVLLGLAALWLMQALLR